MATWISNNKVLYIYSALRDMKVWLKISTTLSVYIRHCDSIFSLLNHLILSMILWWKLSLFRLKIKKLDTELLSNSLTAVALNTGMNFGHIFGQTTEIQDVYNYEWSNDFFSQLPGLPQLRLLNIFNEQTIFH